MRLPTVFKLDLKTATKNLWLFLNTPLWGTRKSTKKYVIVEQSRMNNLIAIKLYSEKIEGKGEDSEPLLELDKPMKLLGVFDGLGGAGGVCYEEDGIVHTGAYHAARIAQNVTRTLFREKHPLTKPAHFVQILRNLLAEEFKDKAAKLDKKPSKLKSSLIKRLPTTAAIMLFYARENNLFDCLSIWAGDSRGYFLTPNYGLCQVTTDDLKSKDDALENLRNDSPLSNYINADTDFILNHNFTQLSNLPCVFLVATDGCFNYVPTPMHFEFILLETLQEAQNEKEWESILQEKLTCIASDDVSMALVAMGWATFADLQKSFTGRCSLISDSFIKPLDNIEQQIKCYPTERELYIKSREETRLALWMKYKQDYEQYMKTEI